MEPLLRRRALAPYAYAGANPIIKIDPLGLVAWSCSDVQVGAGEFWTRAVAEVECTSACVNNRRVHARYFIGMTGPIGQVEIPVSLGGWDLEDDEAVPNAQSLEGTFSIRGGEAVVIIGISYTAVVQGKGHSGWSVSVAGGLGFSAYALVGASKLADKTEGCCTNGPPIIHAR